VDQDVEASEPLVQRKAQSIEGVTIGDVERHECSGLAGGGADLVVELAQADLGLPNANVFFAQWKAAGTLASA
jgi:hypothetical protein